jgi:hypothetical protein
MPAGKKTAIHGGFAMVMGLLVAGCSTPGQAVTATTEVAVAAPTKPVIPPPPPIPSRPAVKSLEAIVEGIVLAGSKQPGATLDAAEWKTLRSTICADLAKGGAGLFLSQSSTALSDDKKWALSDLFLEGAIEGTCTSANKPPAPQGRYYSAGIGWSIIYSMKADLGDTDLKYNQLLLKYADDIVAYGQRYNVDVTGLLAVIQAVLTSGSDTGFGGTVRCSDGWVSSSGGQQGACPHHGGVQ